MRIPFSFIFAVCLLSAAHAGVAPLLKWDVETSLYKPLTLTIRRGETLTLQPRFLSYATPIDMTNATGVYLFYTPWDPSTNTQHYVVTGAVHSVTGGQVRVTWTSAACGSADNYDYEFVITSDTETLVRAFGPLVLKPGIGDSTSTGGTPAAVSTIDWATVQNENTGMAPFLTAVSADTNGSVAYQWGHPSNEYLRAGAVTNVDAGLTNQIATNAAAAYQWGHPSNEYLRAGAVTNSTWTNWMSAAGAGIVVVITTNGGTVTATISTNGVGGGGGGGGTATIDGSAWSGYPATSDVNLASSKLIYSNSVTDFAYGGMLTGIEFRLYYDASGVSTSWWRLKW